MNRNAVYGPNKNKPPQKEISEDALMKAAQPTNMEKTAIDFLLEHISKGVTISYDVKEQAKAMFRQQIEDAVNTSLKDYHCYTEGMCEKKPMTGTEYYKSKYGA